MHESVAGIIAGRIRERYERPTFILVDAADGNGAKGSGRSVEGFSMYDEMCKCKELFSKFGGHPMAAGLSLPVENIDAFRTAINANTQMTIEEMQTVIHIDVPMPFSYIREDLISQLEILEPFGNGNPKPIFAQKNVRIMRKIPIGKQKQFLRMDLQGKTVLYGRIVFWGCGCFRRNRAGEGMRYHYILSAGSMTSVAEEACRSSYQMSARCCIILQKNVEYIVYICVRKCMNGGMRRHVS